MTELVSCPTCRDSLDIPVELLGRPVRCATCRGVFTPSPADAIPTAPRALRVWDRPAERFPSAFDPPAPKSNTWVWLVLGVVALVFGVIVLGCTGLIRTMMNPEMTVHASDEGKFKVALPSPPAAVSRTEDKGVKVVGLTAARPENQETYQALTFDLPADLRAKKTDDQLAALAAAQLPGLAAGTEITRDITDHPDAPSIDLLLHQPGGFMKRVTILRVVLVKERVYVLSVQGVNLDPHMWWVRRFFTSFERTKKE